jgi:hypothetical protein
MPCADDPRQSTAETAFEYITRWGYILVVLAYLYFETPNDWASRAGALLAIFVAIGVIIGMVWLISKFLKKHFNLEIALLIVSMLVLFPVIAHRARSESIKEPSGFREWTNFVKDGQMWECEGYDKASNTCTAKSRYIWFTPDRGLAISFMNLNTPSVGRVSFALWVKFYIEDQQICTDVGTTEAEITSSTMSVEEQKGFVGKYVGQLKDEFETAKYCQYLYVDNSQRFGVGHLLTERSTATTNLQIFLKKSQRFGICDKGHYHSYPSLHGHTPYRRVYSTPQEIGPRSFGDAPCLDAPRSSGHIPMNRSPERGGPARVRARSRIR